MTYFVREDVASNEVIENVRLYMTKHLPNYEPMLVVHKSIFPEDHYLYMVTARRNDGEYAVWTTWNESTKCLNHGHYGIKTEEKAMRTMMRYYWHD